MIILFNTSRQSKHFDIRWALGYESTHPADREGTMSGTITIDRLPVPTQGTTRDDSLVIDLDSPRRQPMSAEELYDIAEMQRHFDLLSQESKNTDVVIEPISSFQPPAMDETLASVINFGIDLACEVGALATTILPTRVSKLILPRLLRRLAY